MLPALLRQPIVVVLLVVGLIAGYSAFAKNAADGPAEDLAIYIENEHTLTLTVIRGTNSGDVSTSRTVTYEGLSPAQAASLAPRNFAAASLFPLSASCNPGMNAYLLTSGARALMSATTPGGYHPVRFTLYAGNADAGSVVVATVDSMNDAGTARGVHDLDHPALSAYTYIFAVARSLNGVYCDAPSGALGNPTYTPPPAPQPGNGGGAPAPQPDEDENEPPSPPAPVADDTISIRLGIGSVRKSPAMNDLTATVHGTLTLPNGAKRTFSNTAIANAGGAIILSAAVDGLTANVVTGKSTISLTITTTAKDSGKTYTETATTTIELEVSSSQAAMDFSATTYEWTGLDEAGAQKKVTRQRTPAEV